VNRLVTCSEVRAVGGKLLFDRADPSWFTFLLAASGLHDLARFRLRE
jgi:hypothetical protein